jgi:acetyl esterase/lipase
MGAVFTSQHMDTNHIKRKWLDIPYADYSEAQKLDIYLPDKGEGPFPVIALLHGGGWIFGDKGDVLDQPFLEALKRNYALVCINYRLSDEAQFPCQIYDCKAAVRYIRANAKNYYLDSEHVGVWGVAAGGHLAALLGTSAKVRELEILRFAQNDRRGTQHDITNLYEYQ